MHKYHKYQTFDVWKSVFLGGKKKPLIFKDIFGFSKWNVVSNMSDLQLLLLLTQHQFIEICLTLFSFYLECNDLKNPVPVSQI